VLLDLTMEGTVSTAATTSNSSSIGSSRGSSRGQVQQDTGTEGPQKKVFPCIPDDLRGVCRLQARGVQPPATSSQQWLVLAC
jgi:hypothetical protein